VRGENGVVARASIGCLPFECHARAGRRRRLARGQGDEGCAGEARNPCGRANGRHGGSQATLLPAPLSSNAEPCSEASPRCTCVQLSDKGKTNFVFFTVPEQAPEVDLGCLPSTLHTIQRVLGSGHWGFTPNNWARVYPNILMITFGGHFEVLTILAHTCHSRE
jgi:hypothetical protein